MFSPCLSIPPLPRVTFQRPLITNSCAPVSKKPHHSMASSSFYEILRIPVGATNEEIKTAYRRLARTFHPDVAVGNLKDASADEFLKIHAAYTTLSDSEKRAAYDSGLFIRRQRPLTTNGFSGYGGRNWETDQCW